MDVGLHGLSTFSPDQLIDRHSCLSSLNIPKSLIDAANRVIQYRTVLPVRAVIASLPDVLDTVGCLTEKERLQVSFDRRFYQIGSLRECGTSVSVKTVLIGQDLNDCQSHSRGLAFNHFDVADARNRHPARCV